MFKRGQRAMPTTQASAPARKTTTAAQRAGDIAEALACDHLRAQGMTLLARNYRVARGPHLRGAEVDLIAREADGTLVFVEVRGRRSGSHGGAAASVGPTKQRRLILAAQHYLAHLASVPPCRFDVIAVDAGTVHWLRGAFDAPG